MEAKYGVTKAGFGWMLATACLGLIALAATQWPAGAGLASRPPGQATPTGGLSEKPAAEMGMKPNQLATAKLSELAPAETAADTGADSSTTANVRNWMECVRTRKKPNADIEAGYNHSVALCMTIAAMQTGQRVTFDDKTQQIVAGGKTHA